MSKVEFAKNVPTQSIVTKYHGPTNYRGSRIIVKTNRGVKRTFSWDYSLNVEDNHRQAAAAMVQTLGWHGEWAMGGYDEAGYVFVQVKQQHQIKE